MVKKSKRMVVRVYIVRHGETQENRDKIIQGQKDTELNANGMEQALMVGEALKDAKIGVAFSSDLGRAVKTAEAILLHHPGIKLHERVELRERGMGELEGLHVDEKLGHAPRGMEPISSMNARASAWWREAVMPWIKAHWEAAELRQGMSQGRRDVLIVSHGGFIGILLQALCKGTVRVEKNVRLTKCLNASISVIEIEGASGKGRITKFSDVSHLTVPLVEENADVRDQDVSIPPRE